MPDYEVTITDIAEKERLVAEIAFGHYIWAQVSDETPGEEPVIEFALDRKRFGRFETCRLPLATLERALVEARQRLADLDKPRTQRGPADEVVEELLRKTFEEERK